MKILATVLLISVVSFTQENEMELNHIYHFPNGQDSLHLMGNKEYESSQYISASEFFVINCNTKDTLIFFDALQNCLINKICQNTLSIIETKYLPSSCSNKWTNNNYLSYNFVLSPDNRIIIDTILLFEPHTFTISNETGVVKEFEEIKKGTKNISEELSYFILYLALNDNAWAIDKLFSMKEELKLDGYIAEINSDAIKIYKTYCNLR